MESVLKNQTKANNSTVSTRSTVYVGQIPQIIISESSTITSYPSFILCNQTQPITLTLSKPDKNTNLIIKDISGASSSPIRIQYENGIDDLNYIILDQDFESLGLIYNVEKN